MWSGASYTTIATLGGLPGAPAPSSDAFAITGDGSIVVGKARNAAYDDVAFLWDSGGGMRELKDVIEIEYGLDIGDWVLRQATGISDIGPNGDFTVVGIAINPNGFTEGFVVYLPPTECEDGVDNEPDGQTDYPKDPDCWSALDFSEVPDCSDGLDNDGDGFSDYPADPECASATDQTELPDCADGVDNDGDGSTDFAGGDIGCKDAEMLIEDPECSDGIDNSIPLNGATDWPSELRCTAPWDLSEQFDCFDGIDNDGDGFIDFAGGDPGCQFANDQSEAAQCSDGIDNDFDGTTDYPAEYPDCVGPDDGSELPQCGDSVDNDGDGQTDYPGDPECTSSTDVREAPYTFTVGDLVVVDRSSQAVFAVDPITGDQSLISQAALLSAPQGVVQRATSELLVADPAGLVEIANGTGAQRLASPPLVAGKSLQVIVDGAGDIKVLEAAEISDVTWNPTGIGAKTPVLGIPTGESPFPVLGTLAGDSIAWENGASTLVVGGLSVYGDGLFRVDPNTLTVTILAPGLANHAWLDVVVETDDTILAVGTHFTLGEGVYRIDETNGSVTALSTGGSFDHLTGIAIDGNGDIFVADAGQCIGDSCIGGEIIAVDKTNGNQSVLASGGFIDGKMDIAVITVPEPGGLSLLVAGLGLLRVLAERRGRVGA
jgi:hypothetical protein